MAESWEDNSRMPRGATWNRQAWKGSRRFYLSDVDALSYSSSYVVSAWWKVGNAALSLALIYRAGGHHVVAPAVPQWLFAAC